MAADNLQAAAGHIERAFEIRESMLEAVRSSIRSEVRAYKLYRWMRFMADTSMKLIGIVVPVVELPRTLDAIFRVRGHRGDRDRQSGA